MTDLREVRVVETYPLFSLASWLRMSLESQRTGRARADVFAEDAAAERREGAYVLGAGGKRADGAGAAAAGGGAFGRIEPKKDKPWHLIRCSSAAS